LKFGGSPGTQKRGEHVTKSEVPECGLKNFHWDTFPRGEKVVVAHELP